jgi:hypothetical protein
MSVLAKVAFFQNRRDEVPNQELARELAATKDAKGIREIAENLWHKNKNVQSDCLKVLYEIGYINPELIADYVDEFLRLLQSKNNRMVWGAMIALASIAEIRPQEIWRQIENVLIAVETGSLITAVWGTKTLAKVAAADNKYRLQLFPRLLELLKKCLARDLPLQAESVSRAVDDSNRREFLAVLAAREKELKPSQLARLKKVLRNVNVAHEGL